MCSIAELDFIPQSSRPAQSRSRSGFSSFRHSYVRVRHDEENYNSYNENQSNIGFKVLKTRYMVRDKKNPPLPDPPKFTCSLEEKIVRISIGGPGLKLRVERIDVDYYGKHSKIKDFTVTDDSIYTGEFPLSMFDRHVLETWYRAAVIYTMKGLKLETVYEFEIPHFTNQRPFNFGSFGYYWSSEAMLKLFQDDQYKKHPVFQEYHDMAEASKDKLPYSKRLELFRLALMIEELEVDRDYDRYSLNDMTIKSVAPKLYSFPISKKKCPDRVKECMICLVRMDKFDPVYNRLEDRLFGFVENVEKDKLTFSRYDGSDRIASIQCSQKYHIKFIPNRIFFRACYEAIQKIQQNDLTTFLEDFEGLPYCQEMRDMEEISDVTWFNQNVASNEEQMLAIKSILNGTAFPYPYVVFGPPGTGKTSTLVEAVAQISARRPDKKILITAQSNSACDEIATRLLKYISRNKIFRYYSPSALKNFNDLDKQILSSSNLRGRKVHIPTYNEFYHFQIVIVTLVSSKRIDQADIKLNYFDYIFIDECASAIEIEALIPVINFGSSPGQITANIVILGDHKQLGPVMESEYAETMGLGESFMERVMKQRRYQRNPEYDSKYVTQLLDNFRSHQAILHFSNTQFYESRLRAKAPPENVNVACNWNLLPKKGFPLILHSILTASEREENSFSWYNLAEINMVKFYLDRLLTIGIDGKKIFPTDIGIVSPYKSQITRIENLLGKSHQLEIGTTEYFQGREKNIMIISTVKSKTSIGFLKNEKRLNVAVTRAKYLMIVIGNPETLQKDPNWYQLVKYCHENGACTGRPFQMRNFVKVQEPDDLTDEMSNLCLYHHID